MSKHRVFLVTVVCILAFIAVAAARLWSDRPVRLWLGARSGGPSGRILVVHGIEFVELLRGDFLMGSDEGPGHRPGDLLGRLTSVVGLSLGDAGDPGEEGPRHWVSIGADFWISRCEITRSQFGHIVPEYHWLGPGPEGLLITDEDRDLPMTRIGRHNLPLLVERLTVASGRRAGLPSEAEWEFACRAAGKAEDLRGSCEHGWFAENSEGFHDVRLKKPNSWGLHDMLGNACERCADSWHDNYTGAPENGSPWIDGPEACVLRGGAIYDEAASCSASTRCNSETHGTASLTGVRLVLRGHADKGGDRQR